MSVFSLKEGGERLSSFQTSRGYGKSSLRPPVPIEPPLLTRFYKQTAQRVKLSIESLRSDAVFLLVSDEDKEVIAWFGSESTPEDREMALFVGLEISTKDYGNEDVEEIPVILEDLERSIQLRYFLDKLWEDEATYRGKIPRTARKKPVANSPVNVYVIEKFHESYLLKEVRRSIPNENGTVQRVSFAPVDKTTIVAVSVGDQWDLWIARGAMNEADNVQSFLSAHIASQLEATNTYEPGGLAGFETTQNIRVVMQGCERRLFRLTFKLLTDFEPTGRTVPYVPTKDELNNMSFNESNNVDKPPVSRLNLNLEERNTEFDDIPTVPEGVGLDEFTPKYASGNPNGDDLFNKKVQFNEPERTSTRAAANPGEIAPEDLPVPSVITELQDRKKNPGKYLLSQEALELREDENIGPEVRMELLEKSIVDPKILIGWQVVFIATIISID
jgi:hypothetical protein